MQTPCHSELRHDVPMLQNVTIRPVAPDEHAPVGELVVRAYRTVYDDLGDYEAVLRRVGHRARHASVLVAHLDGRLVGTVTYVDGPGPYAEGDDPDAGWIRMLAVDESARGRGIGRLLAETCIGLARRSGRHRLLLNTGDPQVVAQRMYERLGFERRPQDDEDVDGDGELWLRGYGLELQA
jgi:GNAT superfamily N-acetyltransferase